MSRLDKRKSAYAVFALALALRLGFLVHAGLPVPIVGDSLEYHEYAAHLVERGAYTGPYGDFATRVPGYPLLLAVLRVLTGGSLELTLAAQCVLGALTCVLLLQLARRLLPEPWPVVCGVLAAVSYDMAAPSSWLLSECAYSFFLVLSAWALYNASWTPARRALAFGALSGVLYLVRPEPLPYIVAVAASLPWLLPGFRRAHAVRALAAAALVAGLWVGRNFVVFGRLVPASSVGNSVGYLTLFLPAEQYGWTPEGRQVAPDGLDEIGRNAWYGERWKELRARLSLGQVVRAYAYNLLSILYPFLPEYDWTYMFLLPFAVLGLWLARKRRDLWPFAGAVLCSIGVLVFFGGPASRYRQGVFPFAVLLAVVGLKHAYDKLGRERARSIAGAWLGANVLVWMFAPQARWLALQVKELITR